MIRFQDHRTGGYFGRVSVAIITIGGLAGCVTPQDRPSPDLVPVERGEQAILPPPASVYAPALSDCDNPLPILARTTPEGSERIDTWLSRNHPDTEPVGRRLTECDGRKTEVITLRSPSGYEFDVSFDISEFFGRTDSGDNLDDLLDG